jgi:hypothetical protein
MKQKVIDFVKQSLEDIYGLENPEIESLIEVPCCIP